MKKKMQVLEEKYYNFYLKMGQLKIKIDDFNRYYGNYIELRNFYGSEKWFDLHECSTINIKYDI
ncbi:hypothetical protein CYQ32_15060 [Enterococcus faecalis]|uniref:DUF4298 domain-containing protein n=1 Tax=Enterococcus faecalis TaxID=1351 RepID=UPI00100FBB89|nr:DUF4298 domain-containing protein [Enterococcus faecalis]RXV26293.1 hypothetical protein CYQ32_15060 [Enterococcus faecalis]